MAGIGGTAELTLASGAIGDTWGPDVVSVVKMLDKVDTWRIAVNGNDAAVTGTTTDPAVQTAVIVKLTRVVLLAPLVAGLGLARRRRIGDAVVVTGRRPPAVPLFVAGFLAAIVIRTTGVVPTDGLRAIKTAQTIILTAALFGLGCGVAIARLRRVGGRPLVLGLISWVLVAGVALVATRVLPH